MQCILLACKCILCMQALWRHTCMYVRFSFGSDASLTKRRWQFDDEAMNHVHRSPGRHVFARDQQECDSGIPVSLSSATTRTETEPVRMHTVPHTTSQVRVPSMLVHVQVCGSKRLSCSTDCQEVSRCYSRGESEEFIPCR